MIMPAPNKKDLIDIPKKVIQDMEFIYVENINEVLRNALLKPAGKSRKPKKRRAK